MLSYRPFVDMAIARRRYVHPEFAEPISSLLALRQDEHPHQIAREFRQMGNQLSADEKRAAGLRANAFMSDIALSSLTDLGREAPIARLDSTFLDAVFAHMRARRIITAIQANAHGLQVDTIRADCPGCKRLRGTVFAVTEVEGMPPEDCAEDACSVMLMPWFDFLAGIS